MSKPELRRPTEEEKQDLIDYYKQKNESEERAKALGDSYNFAVLDGYTSDSPGYCGKVIFALYGYVSAYEVFIYEDDKLTRVPSEHERPIKAKNE